MNDSRWLIGLVDGSAAAERKAVVQLRRQAYAGAREFAWHDLATLGWTSADESGAVFGLWHCEDERDNGEGSGRTLLSTVRASVFTQLADAEAFLEHALDGVGAAAPALVLSRAATAPGEHGRGLLALLRVAYLQALPQAGVNSVLAVVYDDAPRVRSMQAVGYTMTPPQRSWDSEARAIAAPLVAHLPRERFAQALQAATALAATAPAGVQVMHDDIAAALRVVQPSAGASSRRASSWAMLSREAQSST